MSPRLAAAPKIKDRESAELGKRDDLSEISLVDRPPFRRVLLQR